MMQNFWGARCFTGDVKMVNMLTTSLLYLFYYYYYFFNFKIQKCAINIWQDFFRSVSVHELLCAFFFFSNGFEINLLYSQLSLNKHLFRRTTLWCWPLSLSSHLTVTMLSIRRKPLKDGQPTLSKPSTDN